MSRPSGFHPLSSQMRRQASRRRVRVWWQICDHALVEDIFLNGYHCTFGYLVGVRCFPPAVFRPLLFRQVYTTSRHVCTYADTEYSDTATRYPAPESGTHPAIVQTLSFPAPPFSFPADHLHHIFYMTIDMTAL